MKDPVSQARVSQLHPMFRGDAANFINDIEAGTGRKFRIVQGLRTFAEQDAIYAQGRTKPGKIVTYSPAGSSYHNYGIAIDICPFSIDGNDLDWRFDFASLRPYAMKYGITLGIDFPHPDSDHFEKKFGYNWRDLLHKYQASDFIQGTQFVKI